jgi:dihydroorotate dehydrogenase (NAD+) catalytic subunit
MMNFETKLSTLKLQTPLIGASGPLGYIQEWSKDIHFNSWGALCLKTTTRELRTGNLTPRLAEVESGIINSIGLQNVGAKNLTEDILPALENISVPLIGNIGGNSIEDYLFMAEVYSHQKLIQLIEVNISCPNVHHHGPNFAHDLGALDELSKALRAHVTKPIFIKLSPNVPSLVPFAKKCEDNKMDGLTIANTYMGIKINLQTGKPVLANKTGGVSGSAIKPLSLRHVFEVSQNCNLPIIGLGGVQNAEDVLEYLYAGATAVGIGAGVLENPMISKEILSDLESLMNKLQIKNLEDIRGLAWK